MGSKRKRTAHDASAGAPDPKKQLKNIEKPSSKASSKPSTAPTPLDTSTFVDNPKGADLKREVQLYDILSSEDSSERLNAANAIVEGLLGGNGVAESTLQRHLERRLFRGLASGRKGARLGFSVVLAELLAQLLGEKDLVAQKYTGLTFEKVLGFLVAKTKPDGDLSGQEEKDHFLGLLFGLQSFVRAKVLFGDDEDDNRWDTILGKLLELATKKPWIREECGWVIVEALAQMNQSQAEHTLESLHDTGLAQSPEGVGIWLTAKNRFSDMKFPTKPWGQSGNPLEHLKSLAKALKESSNEDESDKTKQAKQTGNWNPQLHFVWKVVLAQYATAAKEKKHGIKSEFENFWKVAVDENLFSASASRERKFWGFLLFQHVLQESASYGKLISSIFSHNLVRCLINHVQEKDRFLNRAADKSLKVLIRSVEIDPKLLVTILPRIIGGYGTYNFDKITKTKTVEKLLGLTDDKNAIAVIKTLLEPALSVDGTIFRNRLMSAFAHLLSDLKGYSFPCNLLHSFSPDAVEMDSGIVGAKDQAISTLEKILKKIEKAKPEKKAPLQALTLLYSLVIFQLYNGEPEAVSILEELKHCYDKLIRHKDTESSNADASEVLVELLLSFISKPSALLRKVTQHVFGAFMTEMTAGGLKLMTDVLEPDESLRGQQQLFDQEPEDGDFMEEGSDDELDSDVEVVDMNGDEGHLNSHLAEEDSEDDGDDGEAESDNEEEDDEDAKKLDEALAKALGNRVLQQGDEESDSDADMTDSEMMALDSKLVEIFSQRKKIPNKKQEQKDAKETVVNFKSHVLDLLEIYVKKQATNHLAFNLLLPLLQLIRMTKTKQLAEKAHNIILAFSKASRAAKKSEDALSVNISEQTKLLKAIHLEASKDPSHMFAKAASSASLLVASSMYKVDKGSVKKIAGVYRDSQVAWVAGEVKMQAAFFVEWVNWCQSHANSTSS
ncbi:putative DNA polymerase V [Hyaloscypha finlandica]|nr:putative DNA polymerase V [Hyaloscypha finlandica]